MFAMVLVGSGYVSFDTDPDSETSNFFSRIRIQGNDTDSTDPDPPHWRRQYKTLWKREMESNINC